MIPPEAALAVSLVAPYLEEMGKGAASKLGEEVMEGAGHVLTWMREKLPQTAPARFVRISRRRFTIWLCILGIVA